MREVAGRWFGQGDSCLGQTRRTNGKEYSDTRDPGKNTNHNNQEREYAHVHTTGHGVIRAAIAGRTSGRHIGQKDQGDGHNGSKDPGMERAFHR